MNNFEKQSLYRERPSVGLEEKIQTLQDLESGKVEALQLSPEDSEKIFYDENDLGEELESINSITTKSASFYFEYFLTEKGKEDFFQNTDIEFPEYIHTEEDVARFFYTNQSKLENIAPKKLSNLAGHSRNFNEDEIFRILSKMQQNNENSMDADIPNPLPSKILFEPNKITEKTNALLEYKKKLKDIRAQLYAVDSDTSVEYQTAFSGILNLYQKRVNILLSERLLSGIPIAEKAKKIGEEFLNEDERTLLNSSLSIENADRHMARYDKFEHGASREANEDGWFEQIPEELATFTDGMEDIYIASFLERDKGIKEKGLDPNKIFEKNISPEQVEEWANETLSAYDQLDESHSTESDADKTTKNSKWKFESRDAYKTMSVNGKTQTIKSGKATRNIADTLAITLGHEIEGHMLQHVTKKKIPLRLFHKLGGDRYGLNSEGGAMFNQNHITEEAFGFSSPPHPHYLRAIQKRLNGGSYTECVQAFYDSAIKPLVLQKERNTISEEEFSKQSDEQLKLAINRTKRLFRGSTEESGESRHLTNSKDTVYLEQVQLYHKLQEHNLEKYLFISGVNIDTAIFLLKTGLLSSEDIEKPKYHSLKIWDRIKDKYALEQSQVLQ